MSGLTLMRTGDEPQPVVEMDDLAAELDTLRGAAMRPFVPAHHASPGMRHG